MEKQNYTTMALLEVCSKCLNDVTRLLSQSLAREVIWFAQHQSLLMKKEALIRNQD